MLNPNPYTGAFGNDGAKYAEDVADVIRTCTPGGVAGFIAETIQGVGGTVPLADGYLPAVYEVRVPASSHLSSSVSFIFGEGGPCQLYEHSLCAALLCPGLLPSIIVSAARCRVPRGSIAF